MSLLKTIKRLEYVNFLIKKRATGDLETFSRKMKLSKSAVRDLISQMRELGASIKYDRSLKTYYYTEAGEFSIAKFMKYGEVLKREEIAGISTLQDLCFSEKAIFVKCNEV